MNEKIAIGLIGVVLSVLLVIQVADVSAQQIVTNGSLNATSNTTACQILLRQIQRILLLSGMHLIS